VRSGNEDALLLGRTLFAVADGMGGHRGGEVASAAALRPLEVLDGQHFSDGAAALSALSGAVAAANSEVSRRSQSEPDLEGMGTTLTALLIDGTDAHLVHVGDSRCYLLREGALVQLTDDHTLVQALIDQGRITRDEASEHPHRSVITRAIGVGPDIEVDGRSIVLAPDDVLLLYAGNLGEKQGLETVLEAARALADQPRLKFVLAGDGTARARLQQAAAGLPNLRWLPLQPLERLNELLGAADLHLLPQRADAADLVMPSKLIGMLASGRAIVGTAAADTQLGRVLDAVGCRVLPGDVPGLVAALQALAADPARRQQLGRAARAYAEAHLSQQAIMARFEAQLQQLPAERA
jgi:serine/threonine protein phosphatase PrpC